jgi:competence protein ComFC
MRCFSCDNLSIKPICDDCIKDFLTPEMIKKEVGNLEVVSFFDYYLTVEFIKSKYTTSGYRVYRFLAQKFVAPFIRSYAESIQKKPLYLIGVDEDISRGYSNVAQMVHYGSLKSDTKALHNVLRAQNRVKYAGESLEFRLNNPRDFIYSGPKGIDAILIDDTVTTGTTIEQAHRVLQESGVNVHFALTLANAKEGMDY